MEKQAVFSMTEGSPVKLLMKFTIPMLIGNLFQQFYNMVDSIVVGSRCDRLPQLPVFCNELRHCGGCGCRSVTIFWCGQNGHGREEHYQRDVPVGSRFASYGNRRRCFGALGACGAQHAGCNS